MVKIRFLNRLFGKEETVEVQAIELQEWFELNSDSLLSETDARISESFRKAGSLLSSIKEHVSSLEKDEMPRDIGARESQLLSMSRSSYIRKVMDFHNASQVPDLSYEDALEYSDMVLSRMKPIETPPADLKAHFSQVKDIEQKVHDIADLAREIKEAATGAEVQKVKEVSDLIRRYNESILLKQRLEKEITFLGKEIEDSRAKRDAVISKTESLKIGKSFSHYNEILGKKKEIEESIAKSRSQVDALFSSFSDHLAKYSDETGDISLKAYTGTAADALLEDKGHAIVGKLADFRRWLEGQEIKQKEKEKLMKKVDLVDTHFIDGYRKHVRDWQREVEDLDTILRKNSAMMDHKELEYQSEHFSAKMRSLEKEISEREETIGSIDLGKMKAALEDELKSLTGKKVIIA